MKKLSVWMLALLALCFIGCKGNGENKDDSSFDGSSSESTSSSSSNDEPLDSVYIDEDGSIVLPVIPLG